MRLDAHGAPAVGAVVLAAGRSTRMGPENKLLLEIDGAPMIVRVVDTFLASRAHPVVVVTGHEAVQVRAALEHREVDLAHNESVDEGMSSSLRVGLTALSDRLEGVVVALGDMPWVTSAHVDALVDAFVRDASRPVCVPVHEGRRGNPVLWPSRYFPRLLALHGAEGARALLTGLHEHLRRVEVDDPGVLTDVDTPGALAARRR